MRILIIANSQKEWPFRIPDVDVVDAWTYLTQPEFSELRSVKVFNLCRSYRYQTVGYYVSLLAEARGHKPLPSITHAAGSTLAGDDAARCPKSSTT